jgi:23S rRNA pseudouridine2605 synthase
MAGEPTIRLNRYLAQCGLGARRKCDGIIKSGHVFVNGQKVTELGTKVAPDDVVEYHGKTVAPIQRLHYLAFNKPAGVMVTRNDPEGRPTIYSALRADGYHADHLNHVGRLDFLSEGLLLLTNDGALIHALTHPRYRIKKVYRVQLDRALPESGRERLISGVESEGQVLHAGAVRSASGERGGHWYEVDLYEGKNRQLRRMFDALSFRVLRLRRIRFASVQLQNLAPGKVRPLTQKEIAGLKSADWSRGGITQRPRR